MNSDINFESWSVDLATATAVHATGFKVSVEGNPSSPSSINPGVFPEGLSAVEQARLLRCGLEAIIKEAQGRGRQQSRARFSERAAAAQTAPPVAVVVKNKPNRPILSLKKAVE